MCLSFLQRPQGRRFRLERLEGRVVGIVAVHAEHVHSLPALKIAGPFAVDPRFPVPVHIPMTLTAKLITMLEVNVVAVRQLQFIPVLRVMAVKTPSLFCRVFELDIRVLVFEHSSFGVRLHARVTVGAWEDALSKRWAWYRKILLFGFSMKGQTEP
jgi:hypothetical protein